MKNNYRDIVYISKFLDSRFTLPGGFMFGVDGIIGLIPGIGDTISSLIGSYIIIRGIKAKFPKIIIYKMTFNLVVDHLIGLIPFVGDIFDFVYKSNLRNSELFLETINQPIKTEAMSWLSLLSVFIIVMIILSAPLVLLLILLV